MLTSAILPLLIGSVTLLDTTAANPISKRHSSGIPFSTRKVPFNSFTRRGHSKRWYGTETSLGGDLQGVPIWTIPITIGGQNFTVEVDTGSADLWVTSKNITCTDATGNVTACAFKSEGYDPSLSPTFHQTDIPLNYNQTYVVGAAAGPVGLDDVTVAGITVPQQLFSYATLASVDSGHNGTNDGIFGLAYPEITKFFHGLNGTSDLYPNTSYFYDPWFFSAVNQSILEPYFTIILDKPSADEIVAGENVPELGSVTFGGIPHDAPWSNISVTAPNVGIAATGGGQARYWGTPIDSINFPGSDSIPLVNRSTPYALYDTGTFAVLLPPLAAEGWHNATSPPGRLVNSTGTPTFYLPCNATCPDLGITVGGVEFKARGSNFIEPRTPEQEAEGLLEGWCGSSIQPENTGNMVVGDSFLWDIIMVADSDKNELTVIQRSDV